MIVSLVPLMLLLFSLLSRLFIYFPLPCSSSTAFVLVEPNDRVFENTGQILIYLFVMCVSLFVLDDVFVHTA